jgi:LPXTG-motif cell wall-anchored protein
VNRALGIARSRTGRVGLVAGLIMATVLALSAPASAHHAGASGSTVCSDSTQVVTWTISANDIGYGPIVIQSATATNAGNTYAVTGYTNPVAQGSSTTATSTLPAGATGSVTLSAAILWTNDNYHGSVGATASLITNCHGTTTTAASTTTTSAPVTTTTAAGTTTTPSTEVSPTTVVGPTTTGAGDTTTTGAGDTTTTGAGDTTTTTPDTVVSPTTVVGETTTTPVTGQGGTSTTETPVTQQAVSTSAPGGTNLPETGSSTTLPVVFGAGCLAVGAALALRKRNTWTRP